MKNSILFLIPLGIFLLILGCCCAPPIALAVAGDEHWDARFGLAGTTNYNQALAVNHGTLVAGGFGTPSTNASLNLWDGNQWSALGIFNNGNSAAYIYDAAFVGSTLYAAGVFTNVNGTFINGLARWDGATWTGLGFSGTGLSLATSGSDLYVGGNFLLVDGAGMVMTNVGRWDGSAWHALGGGLSGNGFTYVRVMALNGGSLYAGGSFTSSGPQAITNLAVWNGSTWSAVGGGANGIVYGLGAYGGNLYAGGAFAQVGSTPANYVARWDGANWYALGGGIGGGVNSLAVFNNLLCVVGGFTSAGGGAATNFAVWNGVSWSGPGSLSLAGLRVISNGTNVYVGGGFGVAGSIYMGGVASWDGNNWSGLGTPGRVCGLQSSALAFDNDGTNLYAGGLFNFAGLTNANYIARFDGTNWYPLGGGIGPSGTTSVRAVAVSSNNVYVGGSFSTAGGVSALNIARWDGTNWNALGNGPGGVVASLIVRTDGVYAAGAPASGVNYGSPFFERWDGSSWQSPLNFNANDTFILFQLTDPNIGMDAVAFLGTNYYIGGHFKISWHDPTLTLQTNCYNIMYFDGTYDRIVGTGLNSNVIAMAVLGTNLYVAGLFTNAGGITASHVAMWNGNTWSALGSGVVGSGTVSTLVTLGTNLYAGGTFTNMGGVPASRIAKWDGTSWYALGSGMSSSSVLALEAFGPDLYAGGSFRVAGGKASYYLARWNDQLNFNIPQLINPTALGNGQFHLKLYGIAGLTNIIQATTNFSSWVPVLTNTAGLYDFTDTSAPNYPRRFYRGELGP